MGVEEGVGVVEDGAGLGEVGESLAGFGDFPAGELKAAGSGAEDGRERCGGPGGVPGGRCGLHPVQDVR